MMPSPLLMALAEMGAQPGGGAPWWATRGGPLEPLNEGMVGPPGPTPGPRPAPYSGPGGFHPINDIMTLHGTYRQPVSAYGEGMPSNYDIYRQRLEQAPVQADTLRSQAAMAQAQAMQAQADVAQKQYDPAYLQKQAALASLTNPNLRLTPGVQRQYRQTMGFAATPEEALDEIAGASDAGPDGKPSTPDQVLDKVLANPPPGGYGAGTPQAEALYRTNPKRVGARLQGQPLHWYERELYGGDRGGYGAFNLGDIPQLGIPWAIRNWVNPFFDAQGLPAPTPRQVEEQRIGALLPGGVGKLRPGARVRAQMPDQIGQSIAGQRKYVKELRERFAESPPFPS